MTQGELQGRQRLDSLTGLRFLAAGLVFLRHITWAFDRGGLEAVSTWIGGQGAAGVSFFFLLSGFVLMYSHRRGDTHWKFYRRRFSRIYPNHLATFMLALVILLTVIDVPIDPGIALLNVLLIQAWVPVEQVWLSINGVSWTLSCEAFFYLLFPMLVVILTSLGLRGLRRVLVGAIAITVLLPYANAFIASPDVKVWFTYAFPPARLGEFVVGIILAQLLLAGRLPSISFKFGLAVAFAGYLAAAIPGHYATSVLPGSLSNAAVTLIPFGILIVSAAKADLSGRRSVVAGSTMVTLGTWSYAFYLIHDLLIITVRPYLEPLVLSPLTGVAAAAGLFVASIALAAVLFKYVERPAEKWLRGDKPRLMLEVAGGGSAGRSHPGGGTVGSVGTPARVQASISSEGIDG